jgi:predicted DCC family thiol-disulfide oxidoreductase YuxK
MTAITAVFDGRCVICNQTRRIVTALDWRQQVEFLDLHHWDEVAARFPALDYDAAMGQIHVVDSADGQVYAGFAGTRRMLRELPLTLPLALLLQLPGLSWVGERVYRWIARHRYRINKLLGVDVCENGACEIHV